MCTVVDPVDSAAGVPMQGDTMGAVVAVLVLVACWALSAVRRPAGGSW